MHAREEKDFKYHFYPNGSLQNCCLTSQNATDKQRAEHDGGVHIQLRKGKKKKTNEEIKSEQCHTKTMNLFSIQPRGRFGSGHFITEANKMAEKSHQKKKQQHVLLTT